MDLNETRLKINGIDSQMAELFEQRMKLVVDVAAYKKAKGLPIYDAVREREVLNRNSAYIKDEELVMYYQDFMQHIMDLAKKYEDKLLSD